ncbi:hypothetical protein [Rufibacter tibetensis]|nr:hypothetical protein [Rufibacter tibetensis]
MDYRYKFFNAKDVASFIRELPGSYLLASTNDAHASTVVAYLDQPIYFLSLGRYSTYFEVNPSLDHRLTPSQFISWAMVLSKRQKKPVLLISQFKIAVEWLPYPAKLLKGFDRNYILPYRLNSYVYLIEPSAFAPNHFMGGEPSEIKTTSSN